jgi:hypothetical protein
VFIAGAAHVPLQLESGKFPNPAPTFTQAEPLQENEFAVVPQVPLQLESGKFPFPAPTFTQAEPLQENELPGAGVGVAVHEPGED